jgi:hypothetical protein
MSQDQDPIDATRRFEPVDPYNISAEGAGASQPGYEGYQAGFEPAYGSPQPPEPPRGFKERLTRLGALKLALLGTGAVIVLGGAALGTTAALQSSGSSSNTAATAPATDQGQTQTPGADATTGAGRKAKLSKPVRITITQLEAGTIHGTDAKGTSVTVVYDDNTKFGTKKNPLDPARLDVGRTITVAGARQGDTITATAIEMGNLKAKAPATPGEDPSPPAAATSGSADGNA